jgi:glycine/serine hydroxymethyltransferase
MLFFAKAVSFKEVLDPAFKDYAQKVIENNKPWLSLPCKP